MSLEDLAGRLDDLSRNREALALLVLQGERAVPVLAEVLLGPPSSIPDARCLAAEGLGAVGGEAAVSALIRVLSLHELHGLDPVLRLAEEAIRNRAAEQLGKIGDHRAVEPLLSALAHGGLREAMAALARFGEVSAIPHIASRLEDPCDRAAAADALVTFGTMAVSALTAALVERRPSPTDEAPVSIERRAEAARLLGILGDRPLIPILSACLEDPAGIVQLEVALALATLLAADAPGHALAIIPQNLGHPSLPVQMRCLDALVTMGDRAIPHLMARGGPRLTAVAAPRLPSQDALQVTVIEILERIGTEASVRALQDFLRDRSALVRARAQRTLQHPAIGALDSGGDRPALDRPRTNCRGEVSR
jgi:HEAT repeat protein